MQRNFDTWPVSDEGLGTAENLGSTLEQGEVLMLCVFPLSSFLAAFPCPLILIMFTMSALYFLGATDFLDVGLYS